jgi:hypothetical protein
MFGSGHPNWRILPRMSDERLVAVADLLGFRRAVFEQGEEIVVQQILGYVRKALFFALRLGDWPEDAPSLAELRKQARVGLAWFSDTVLLYSLSGSDEHCSSVMQVASWLLFVSSIPIGARMRIGVDFGTFHADEDNQVYVGKALINAYELQERQQWFGGALTEAAYKKFRELRSRDVSIINYSVPGKGGSICSYAALNWTFGIHDRLQVAWSETSLWPTSADEREQPDVVEKWRNARIFHDLLCTSCGSRWGG